jgi:hypothetical protein
MCSMRSIIGSHPLSLWYHNRKVRAPNATGAPNMKIVLMYWKNVVAEYAIEDLNLISLNSFKLTDWTQGAQ